MQVLDVYAGKNALARIKKEGFSADLFDYMLGASGGPKWFVLAGLDRYIFPEFFAGRTGLSMLLVHPLVRLDLPVLRNKTQ